MPVYFIPKSRMKFRIFGVLQMFTIEEKSFTIVLLNFNIGVLNSNFLILTPTFLKSPNSKVWEESNILKNTSFLSYLLIAGCDIGVQISVHPLVCQVCQHLRRRFVFSTSVIAVSLKPCIVIVLDKPFKHAP